MSSNDFLLRDRLAGRLPAFQAIVEMIDGHEAELLEYFECLATPMAGGAMHKITFGFVELTDVLLKVIFYEIDILRAGDVCQLVFIGGADINDSHFAVLDEFFGGVGVHMSNTLNFLVISLGDAADHDCDEREKDPCYHGVFLKMAIMFPPLRGP